MSQVYIKPTHQTKCGVFDYRDTSYYWGHFVDEMERTLFNSYEDVQNCFVSNFNRVCVVIKKDIDIFYIKCESTHDNYEFDKAKKIVFSARYIKKGTGLHQYVDFRSLYRENIQLLTRYDDFIFRPYDINKDVWTDKNLFNLYTGFKAQYQHNFEGSYIKLLMTHIREIICDSDEVKYEYFLSWLSHIVRTPWLKTETMIVLFSQGQQSGKGILAEFLVRHLFGDLAVKTPDLEHILGKFNSLAENRLFVCFDDPSYNRKLYDKMKSAITDEFQVVKWKGVKSKQINCYNNFMMLQQNSDQSCNNFMMLPQNTDHPRYKLQDDHTVVFAINESRIGDHKYFDALHESLTQECADHFYTYLYNRTNNVDLLEIPNTIERQHMIEETTSAPEKFMNDLKNESERFLTCEKLTRDGAVYAEINDFFGSYISWSVATCTVSHYSRTTFGKEVRRRLGEQKKIMTPGTRKTANYWNITSLLPVEEV